MKSIRDPLHGAYIKVHEDELDVVESQPVQRLRRVHQLGLSSVVYPGATHTRFEHSLGVMHLAGEMAESVGLNDRHIRAYRMAGLLHDVGHSPFSHATEAFLERDLGVSHEELSCQIVDDLASEGILPVEPLHVKDIIRGDSEFPIVAADVDVDRMDYLQRDAHNTGIDHGRIDAQTIIQFADIVDGDIVFDETCLQALEDLFMSRFHMTRSIYEHHTSKIAEAMLRRAVDYYLNEDTVTMDDVASLDDHQLHARLYDRGGLSGDLYTRLADRSLFKRALYLGESNLGRDRLVELSETISDIEATEREIADLADVSSHHVLVDPPQIPSGGQIDVKVRLNETITQLAELSPVPSNISDAEWRNTTLGVYTPTEHREEVSEAARRVLGV